MKSVNWLLASAFIVCAGCSSMGNGVIAVELNTVVFDDYTANDPVPGTDLNDKDVNVKGVGGVVAFNTPIVDFTAGYERREFAGANADEASLGIRKRFLDLTGIQPYLDFRVLGGQLDNGDDNSDYTGASLGGGVLFNIGDHFFIDGNISYEITDKIDLGPGDTAVEGLLARFGIGWSF